jgi:hypothetical protein
MFKGDTNEGGKCQQEVDDEWPISLKVEGKTKGSS